MGARLMAISRRLVVIWFLAIPGHSLPAGLPTRPREYLISWPMGARLTAISRRFVAIWFLVIWLYGLGVWWPKLLAIWLT